MEVKMYYLNFNGNSYQLEIIESFTNGFVVRIENFNYQELVSNDPFGDIAFCDGTMTITNPNSTTTGKVSGNVLDGVDDIFVLKFPA